MFNYHKTKYIDNNFKIDVSVFTLINDINHTLFKHIYNIHDLNIITIAYLNRDLFKLLTIVLVKKKNKLLQLQKIHEDKVILLCFYTI